jgi:hypothetical protein
MKTTTRIFGLALITMAVILMNACKSEKGDVGPAGPIGATGATGQTGATGTANVIYSDWITVSFTGSGTVYTAVVAAPKITQEVLDKCIVLSYYNNGSGVYSVNAASGSYTLIQGLTVGKITYTANQNFSSVKFRYVIIPGGVSIGNGRIHELKSKSYVEIKEMFNIPD